MAQIIKGIVGEKIGMTQVFDEQSRVIPVTVIKAGPCRVAQVKTSDKDGYGAIQLAFDELPPKRLTKPEAGHLSKNGLGGFSKLVELRVADPGSYTVGQEIKVDIFAKGDKTDVIGVSKGKGFAGVMKRHNFAGKPASHGTDRKHRSPGSIGACATPSRVFKGMRMAGHMGHERVTTLNLEVVQADLDKNLLLVRGAVPGPNGGYVVVRSAIRGGA
ncbi:MAG: 50S ribosomal protein L3 [Actinomycetota bacterium]|nr:50S ribosomal protein L3 [Actinomycetota bacterium]